MPPKISELENWIKSIERAISQSQEMGCPLEDSLLQLLDRAKATHRKLNEKTHYVLSQPDMDSMGRMKPHRSAWLREQSKVDVVLADLDSLQQKINSALSASTL